MAHPDLDTLLNALLGFAEKMVSEHGEFYPFGSTMNLSGEVAYTSAYGGDEHPASQTLIDSLSDVYRHQVSAKEIRPLEFAMMFALHYPERKVKLMHFVCA